MIVRDLCSARNLASDGSATWVSTRPSINAVVACRAEMEYALAKLPPTIGRVG